MRIGIDGRLLCRSSGGMRKYIAQIIEHLLNFPNLDITLFLPDINAILPSHWKIRRIAFPDKIGFISIKRWWEEKILPYKIASSGIQVMHFPDHSAPLKKRGKCAYVLTLHDVALLSQPQIYDPDDVKKFQRLAPLLTAIADKILTDSHFSKNEILKHLSCPADKVEVVYPGIDPVFSKEPLIETFNAVRQKYKLPPTFILHVGGNLPNKNIIRLVQAFDLFQSQKPSALNLILVARECPYTHRVRSLIETLPARDKIRYLYSVTDEELPVLYRLADFLVFPSLYEGFGFPPLEAMSGGTPVISSKVASLPEILGEAVRYVDPLDEEDIAKAMAELYADEELKDHLRREGKSRAFSFSWEKQILHIINVYTKAAEGL